MSEEVDVAIVGGGVAGAATACALGGDGLRVRLYERRSLSNDANRGDAVHGEAIDHVRDWEALEPLERRGGFWVRRTIFTTPRDRPLLRVSIAESPIFMLAHADIEQGLAEAAGERGVDVVHATVRSVARDDGHWRVRTDDGEVRARLLVGADGGRSLVRRSARIDTEGVDYGQATVVLHAPRPRWLPDDSGWALIHPDGGVLMLPTTPRGTCRVVAQVEERDLPAWRRASDVELRRLLGRRNPRLGELDVARHGGSHVYKLGWRHARRYVCRNLVLVGDAAHVTHPNGGQGMSLAIHDASLLRRLVLPALRDGDAGALQRALWEYAARRRPTSGQALARADRVARFQRPSPLSYGTAWTGLALASLAPPIMGRLFAKFGGD